MFSNIQIDWQTPYKVIGENGKDTWKREWLIPVNLRSPFFIYWKSKGFLLKSKGYSIAKKELDWFLIQTVKNPNDFNTVSTTTPPAEDNFELKPIEVKTRDGLRPWQVDAVSKLCSAINHWGAAIDGSDMGIGKTYSAIGVARELNVPFIVVCPKAVKHQWHKVITNHFKLQDNCIDIVNYELLIRGRKDSKICELVKDRETRRFKIKWKIPKNALIIYDEAHKLKNFETKNSKFCMDALKNGYKMLFLSATVAINPIDLRTIGTALKIFKSSKEYYAWIQNCGCVKGRWSWEFNNSPTILKKINKILFEQKGLRLKRDLIPNFPETEIIVDAFDLDKNKTKKINDVYRKMKEEIKRLSKLKDKSENELTIRLRNRQIIELLKTDLFIELANDGVESGMSVIVFLNYSESIDVLSTALNTKCIFDGRLNDEVRNENLRKFQDNTENIILINLKAGNVGLNMPDLDGNHPRLTLISPDDSAVVIKQCLGRAVRENSKSKTIQKIVLANNTIEVNVVNNLQQKLNNIELINDGDVKI